MITGFCPGVERNLRSTCSLSLASLAFILSTFSGCANSTKPQVASITFTTDSTGATPVCTKVIASETPANTPVCSSALLPSLVAGGQAAHLYANVIHDNQDLGVSWTVTCGSATPTGSGAIDTSCGTFSYAQTLSGPVPLYNTTGIVTAYNPPSAVPKGQTVTITAHATSLPSVASSVTLNIVAAQSSVERSQQGRSPMQMQTAWLSAASPASRVKYRTQRSGL